MNYWSWSAFVPIEPDQGVDIFLHFFPAAMGISAPYPVHARVTLFAGGRIHAEQSFDGLKLNQPDGLELMRLFSVLTDSSYLSSLGGMLGLKLELGIEQSRADLSLSRIIVELAYPSRRVRYHAAKKPSHYQYDLSTQTEDESEVIAMLAHPVHIDDCSVAGRGKGYLKTKLIEVDSDAGSTSDGAIGYRLNSTELEHSAGAKVIPLQIGDRPLVRYLAQYEQGSSLPLSVRCL
jgi:hypothetical protein